MTQGRDTGKMRHQENREVGIGEHGGSRGKERKRWQLRRSTTIFAIWAPSVDETQRQSGQSHIFHPVM